MITHKIKQVIGHAIKSRYWHGHGVHSPYVYHLTRHVIPAKFADKGIRGVMREYRNAVKRDEALLYIEDYGTGSNRHSRVCDIAKRAGIPEKNGLLLSRLVSDLRPMRVLELGTSLGISTGYMALGCRESKVITIEGAPECSEVARKTLGRFGMKNVETCVGRFEDVLPAVLEKLGYAPEFCFVDGNHTYEATVRYADLLLSHINGEAPYTMIVFDDINMSAGMTKAFKEIAADERVQTSMDLGRFGIAIVRKGCQKEHYKVRW